MEFLKDSTEQYVFISSISAYADFSQPNFDETTPLATLTEEQKVKTNKIDAKGEITAVVLEDMYGALKALCEQEAEKAMPGKTLIVRSGLIVGSFDTRPTVLHIGQCALRQAAKFLRPELRSVLCSLLMSAICRSGLSK